MTIRVRDNASALSGAKQQSGEAPMVDSPWPQSADTDALGEAPDAAPMSATEIMNNADRNEPQKPKPRRDAVYDDVRPLSDRTPEDIEHLAQVVSEPLTFADDGATQ